MSDKNSESFPLCDLCGDHHERLAGEKEGECPEAWAVEHLRQYESMYLKWVESEQNLQAAEEREKILIEALEFYSSLNDGQFVKDVSLEARQALERLGGGE